MPNSASTESVNSSSDNTMSKGSRHRCGDYATYQNNLQSIFGPKLKFGDMVTVHDLGSTFHGKTGMVVREDPPGTWLVDIEELESIPFWKHELRKS